MFQVVLIFNQNIQNLSFVKNTLYYFHYLRILGILWKSLPIQYLLQFIDLLIFMFKKLISP